MLVCSKSKKDLQEVVTNKVYTVSSHNFNKWSIITYIFQVQWGEGTPLVKRSKMLVFQVICSVYKILYNWPNRTIGKYEQCPKNCGTRGTDYQE